MRLADRLDPFNLVPAPHQAEHHHSPAQVAKNLRIGYTCARVGYRFGFQRGFGHRVASLAGPSLLCLTLNIPSARAADEGVVVTCPDLAEARTAELEARARATLLTSELAATVAISCAGDGVAIRVEAGEESVTLKVRVGAATLREEVLRALDRALADLRARRTPEPPGEQLGSASSDSSALPESAPTPAKPAASPPAAVAPAEDTNGGEAAAEGELPKGWQPAVQLQVMGESWAKAFALGGGIGVGVSRSSWRLGLRAGALHPFGLDDFAVVEGHALAEAAFTASALAGLQLGVAAGPSVLLVSPSSGLSASGATLKTAARFEAQLSRPFRLGRVVLSPWLGLRFFNAERGVRIAQHTRLVLGGVLPQGGLALSLGD